jgi:transposase
MSSTALYPITEEYFDERIKPLRLRHYNKSGRPSSTSYYTLFCASLYVLKTGVSWRNLPEEYGHWHNIYQRFKRWSDRGVIWKILYELQQDKALTMNVVIIDSTAFKVHRHGGGLKGGSRAKAKIERE